MDHKIYAAPLQGYTDAIWRKAQAEVYGGIDIYFTPFLRVDKGTVRSRDLRQAMQGTVGEAKVIPQIIFGSVEEFSTLSDILVNAGTERIDLNLGCPFPPQVKHGRGAGAMRQELLEEIAATMSERYPSTVFSAKMRLGINSADEWRAVVGILDTIPLDHITLHPRIARQQYGGELYMDMFEEFLNTTRHHVIYNGDILGCADIDRILAAYGKSVDLMIGRGLLGRPSLAAEYRDGEEWPQQRRIEALRKFHDIIYGEYTDTLCGDTQILQKIKPMWDWLENEIGRKPWKAIHKATSIQKYENAVADALTV